MSREIFFFSLQFWLIFFRKICSKWIEISMKNVRSKKITRPNWSFIIYVAIWVRSSNTTNCTTYSTTPYKNIFTIKNNHSSFNQQENKLIFNVFFKHKNFDQQNRLKTKFLHQIKTQKFDEFSFVFLIFSMNHFSIFPFF